MPTPEYRRHEPEKTLLYQVVRENLETFFDHCRNRASGVDLPRYVVGAFRRFLKCGILQHGFARVRCRDCGYDKLVAFSCKERSLCPSCAARRMSEMAAHLVDKVFPVAPVRQWVLSLPFAIRFIFARDARLLSAGLRIFAAEVFRRQKKASRVRRALPGGVTAVQRFGSALNLNVHFHSIMLDGVFVAAKGKPEFRKVEAPTEEELSEVVHRTAARILELLRKKGYEIAATGEVEEAETGVEAELFDAMKGASVRGLVAGEGPARRVPVVGRRPEGWPAREPGRWSALTRSGFSLHAGVRITGGDREGLEQLCRYGLRPPLSGERFERLSDGRILYGFRKPRGDGSTGIVLTPLQLLEKLAALIPPPRAHLLVYHGVLGPRSRHRKDVVPAPDEAACEHEEEKPRRGGQGRKRLPWAELLKRTFGIDALECPRCKGRMSVIACIEDPEVIRKILRAKGLPLEAPRAAPARPPPDEEPGGPGFEFDQRDMDEASG